MVAGYRAGGAINIFQRSGADMGIVGDVIGAGLSLFGADKGRKDAKKFAKHSIEWRVQDAKNAGINPLYALGAPTFSPYASIGSSYDNAGQALGRAADAATSPAGRADGDAQLLKLAIEHAGLENDLLKQQLIGSSIAKVRQPGAPPAPPAVAADLIKSVPQEVTRTGANPSQEPGSMPEMGFLDTAGGGKAPVMSRDAADRQQDNFAEEMSWNLRNRLLPSIGFNSNPPPKSDKGFVWMYNPLKQEYDQVPVGGVWDFLQNFQGKDYLAPHVSNPKRRMVRRGVYK